MRRSNPGAAAHGASQVAAHTVSYNPVGVRQSAVRNFHAPLALRLHHGQRPQRHALHREGLGEGFTRRYRRQLLVFYEAYERMDEAIAREKQLEGGSRAKKMAVEAMNLQWRDLYADFA